MHRKLICTIASVAMLAGLLFIGATPAQAAPPSSANNFNPQDSAIGLDGIDRLVLTDKFDGVDTLAHFSSVATTDATQAFYVVCPQGTDPTGPPADPVPPAACETVGNDTTGTVPVNTATGQPNLDEAYEFFWDIPSTFNEITRDILVYHCNGSPTADEPGGNCALEIEPDVFIDDALTATSTTGAEYLDYCVDFNGDADCADPGETREAFGHGATIPNLEPGQQLLVRARSSDDGITTLTSCLDGAADATALSIDDCSISDSSGGQAAPAFKNYTFVYDDTDVPDSGEMAFFLHNLNNDGSGACSGFDCLLDSHYVVSTAREARSAVLTFENPELTRAENCAAPDDAEANDLGDFESVLFCVADQFGEPISTDVTFESTGVASAGFDSGADCTAQNHDGSADGVDEHCDGATDTDGIAQAVIQNPDDFDPGEAATPGDQIVTACVEGEPFVVAPVPADHGCADETLVDSVTKTWDSVANTVRLVFGDKTADCFTGPTFRENRVGDTDNLLACVFDGFGNPTSTTGDDDGFLEWSIDPGNDDDVDTQFLGVPPSETDAEGEAVAQIEAIDPGSDDPGVCLRENTTGDFLSCDFVQKNVRPAGPGPTPKARSNVSINHKTGPHRFNGRVTSPRNSCEGAGRTVVVKRRRPGPDRTIGNDQTNGAGRYVVRHRRTSQRKTYYARVRSNADCRADNSRNIRRR